MQPFTYDILPGRVVFETGGAERLLEELDRLGRRRVLFIASPRWRDWVAERLAALGERGAGHVHGVVAHTPGELVDEIADLARDRGVDCAVAIGGGGAVGLAKTTALAVDGIDAIAIPTTYSGSEMTPLIGITRDGVKRVVRDLRVLPKLVIYDPGLHVGVPPDVTGPSGMNALAHCVEALYAETPNPVIGMFAEAGIRHLTKGLPAAVRDPNDLSAREDALYGAYLAGTVIGVTGVAVHHATCHVLGGTFGIGHGEANSVILPHAAKFNAEAAAEPLARVAHAMGAENTATAIYDLAAGMGVPMRLADLGLSEHDLDRAAALVVEHTKYNPRPLDIAGVRAMLQAAYTGECP